MVKDLKEAESVAFQDLFDVTFTGCNGAGCVTVMPRTEEMPWSFSTYRGEPYIDNIEFEIISQTGNAGALSNGDTFTIGIAPAWEDSTDYFMETYGTYISNEEMSCTVSGLADAETVDVLSMVETTFSGVDGTGQIVYFWDQEEYRQGNVRVVPNDSQGNRFTLYIIGVPDAPITVLSGGESLEEQEESLGQFYLACDKDKNISAGDIVTVAVQSDRFDNVGIGALIPYGVDLSPSERSIAVDAAMLPRFVTSTDQVNETNMYALAASMTDSVTNALYEDWGRIVHGNRNFNCYDQAITEGPTPWAAYILCTDTSNNAYTIWIVYGTLVTDSELDGSIYVYSTVQLDRPVVYQDEANTLGYTGSTRLEHNNSSMDFVYDSWWYADENTRTIHF